MNSQFAYWEKEELSEYKTAYRFKRTSDNQKLFSMVCYSDHSGNEWGLLLKSGLESEGFGANSEGIHLGYDLSESDAKSLAVKLVLNKMENDTRTALEWFGILKSMENNNVG